MASGRVLAIAGVGALALVTLGFLTFNGSAEKIHQLELKAASLKAQRDSIEAVAQVRDSLRDVLDATTVSLTQRSEVLRQRVVAIEAGREIAERKVWLLRSSDETERAFREAYPEFAGAMRMTEYQPEPNAPRLNYVMLPANTAQSFMVYRLRSDSLGRVRNALQNIIVLQDSVVTLKDSIIRLTRLNERAFRTGYDSAYVSFEKLRQDYVALARQPRFSFNAPTLMTVGGALAIGFVLGTR